MLVHAQTVIRRRASSLIYGAQTCPAVK